MNWNAPFLAAALAAFTVLSSGTVFAQLSDVTQPGDAIVATSTNSPATEGVANAIDNQPTKYLNFDEFDAGFTVTPTIGRTIVRGLTLTSANDAPARDPASFRLEGSDDGTNFTLIASNSVSPFPSRLFSQSISFANNTPYLIYRLIFPTVSDGAVANSMQIAEVELLGLPCQSYTITVRPGFQLIANHLDTGSNTLNEIMPGVPAGTTLYKFNNDTGTFTIAAYEEDDFGNLAWSPNVKLNPGEGAYLANNSGAAFNLTFVGKPHTPVLPVNLPPEGDCYLLSRQTLGPGTYDNIVGTAPEPGTRVYRFDNAVGNFVGYEYDLFGSGWTPSDPSANVGESLWVCCPSCSFPALPCTPPTITVQPQPASQTVAECSCVTYTVGATGTAPLSYQWFFNGAPIVGATGSTYTKCPVSLADAGQYSVTVANGCGNASSVVVTLNVIADTTPPTLVSAMADCVSNKVTLVFSESLESASAADAANYTVTPGVTISSGVLLADGKTVCLYTSPLADNTVYSVTVNGVKDLCGNQITSDATLMVQCSTNCCDGCLPPYPVSLTVTVNPGFNLLVNPFCRGANNLIGEVLADASPGIPVETKVHKWDKAAQNATSGDVFDGVDWLDNNTANPSTTTLPPGEGFILFNPGAAFQLTFRGCEPTNCPPRCAPTNVYCLVGQFGAGTPVYYSNLFICPPECGTRVRIWNGSTYDDYDFVNGAWTPQVPVLAAGQSAFVAVLDNTNCCLRVSNELLTCATNAPGKLNYSFTLQNSTGVPVTYLYLVPKDDCFTIMPSIFTFRPPLSPGQTTNLSVMIQVNGDCPTNLCFLLAALDSNFVNCCSIMHCVDRDTTPPVFTGCTNILVTLATGQSSAIVNYVVTATDAASNPVTLTCSPPPPGPFLPGTTLVTCLAVDACGNSNTCQFNITVLSLTNCCDDCFPPYPASYTVTVLPGFNYLVNHLCQGTNNTVDVLLPSVPDGTQLLKWDQANQNYDPIIVMDIASGGWIDNATLNDASGVTLEPGKGFVLGNFSGAAFTITFAGCEPTNCPLPCLPTNGCALVGRLGIGTATWTNLSSCPPVCGTRISVFNPTTANFDHYDFLNGGWTPMEPVLAIGQSALVCLTNCVCPCPNATNAPTPGNDLCANAIPISTGIHYGYTFNATPSPAGSITPTPCGQSVNSPDVWYTFTAPCPGGIVTLDTCLDPCVGLPPTGSSAPFNTVLSVYTGTCPLLNQVVCNNDNITCSNAPLSSKVSFKAQPCVPYFIRVAGHLGATGCFALNATFQAASIPTPGNDLCANATPIRCNETRQFNACRATTGGPNTPGCTFDQDVWFKYVPPCTGTVSVATCGSFFDTVLAVYDGSCNSLNLLACNNDATTGPCTGSPESYLTFQATTANKTYYIRVGGTNGAACTGKLTVIGPNPSPGTCPSPGPCLKRQRVFQVVGNSTGNAWSWCLSSPCCFNLSNTVPAGTVPAGAPASALAAAMVASINAVCPNTAVQFAGINNSKFKIKVCICANCPSLFPFVFRVGPAGASCDDMCVVNPPNIVSIAGACVFNPGISEEPLSQQDCNQNGEDDTIDILNGTSQDNDENGVPDECPTRLYVAYEASSNEVVISWPATDAILEQSTNVNGPWDEVLGATSPHVVGPPTGQTFFRLRLP